MTSSRGSDAWPLGGGTPHGRARGMGGGLAAIMAVSTDPASAVEEFRQVAVELISPNPRQPRRRFDDAALAALAASMETRGLLQPVLVRPLPDGRFELIAGERRWRAAQLAGIEAMPALVRARDDAESLELALIANMMRLLDLPDEALELLERGVLSEGHGRALLTATDHGARRRLARSAADEG